MNIPIEITDEFDEAWFGPEEPRIEDFLSRVDAPLRQPLLAELVVIEWEKRKLKGQRFDFGEYLTRFPEAASWLRKLWVETIETASEEKSTDEAHPAAAKPESTRFRIEGLWARGGIGEIFLAWDRSLPRQVAMKILQAQNVNSEELRRRFRREAEVIGKLEHPGIIPIYAYGKFGNGEPYYAMRMVKGGQTLEGRIRMLRASASGPHVDPSNDWESNTVAGPLRKDDPTRQPAGAGEARPAGGSGTSRPESVEIEAEAAAEGISPTETRALLERFLALTDTVAFAHSQGVLHRDIKPGNVILGPFGETFLVDWGFALDKNAQAEPGEEISEFDKSYDLSSFERAAARTDRFIGTPTYCAPEQARGLPCRESCDIYSLGATLYHIMTGKPPRIAVEGEDERLRQQAIDNHFVPPRQANPQLDRAMEKIILKAMNRWPPDRYASARELGDDVRRWMADEPVQAWNEPWSRWAGRIVRHNRRAAAIVSFLSIATLIGGLYLRETFRKMEQDRMVQAFRSLASEIQVSQERFVNIADKAADTIETRTPGWTIRVDELLSDLARIRSQHPEGLYPRIERLKIGRLAFSDMIASQETNPPIPGFSVSCVAQRPGTRQIAVAEFKQVRLRKTCRIVLVDADSGRTLWRGAAELRRFVDGQDGFRALTFSPDGKFLVAASRYGQGFVWKLDLLKNPEQVSESVPDLTWTIQENETIERLNWAESTVLGHRLVSLSQGDTIAVWSWSVLENAAANGGNAGRVDPLASRKFEPGVSDILTPPGGEFDDRTLFAAIDGQILRLDARTLEDRAAPPRSHAPGSNALLAWHPSGMIVAASKRAISIVDPRTGQMLRELRDPQLDLAHLGAIDSLQISSNGQYAITFSDDEQDHRIKIWNLDDPKDLIRQFLPGDPGNLTSFCIMHGQPDEASARVWVSQANSVTPYDLIMPTLYDRLNVNAGKVLAMDIADESRPRVALISSQRSDGRATLDFIDATDRRLRSRRSVKLPDGVEGVEVALAPNGEEVALALESKEVRIVRGLKVELQNPRNVTLPGGFSRRIGWDDRDRLFGCFDANDEIRLLPPKSMGLGDPGVRTFSHVATKLTGLGTYHAITARHSMLYAGGRDGTVRAWKTDDPPSKGAVSRMWNIGKSPVFSLAATEDGQWLVCGNQSGELHLIDTDSAGSDPVMSIGNAHEDLVSAIAISKLRSQEDKNRIVASGARNGSLRLWVLRRDDEMHELVPLEELPSMGSPIRKIQFVRTPKLALAVHAEGSFSVRLWAIERILEMDESARAASIAPRKP